MTNKHDELCDIIRLQNEKIRLLNESLKDMGDTNILLARRLKEQDDLLGECEVAFRRINEMDTLFCGRAELVSRTILKKLQERKR